MCLDNCAENNIKDKNLIKKLFNEGSRVACNCFSYRLYFDNYNLRKYFNT